MSNNGYNARLVDQRSNKLPTSSCSRPSLMDTAPSLSFSLFRSRRISAARCRSVGSKVVEIPAEAFQPLSLSRNGRSEEGLRFVEQSAESIDERRYTSLPPSRITRAIAFLSIPGKDYRSVSRKYRGNSGRDASQAGEASPSLVLANWRTSGRKIYVRGDLYRSTAYSL